MTGHGVSDVHIFPTEEDFRYFASLLARLVAKGLIEVHAYSVLGTHFHLLLKSPIGELSRAMNWVMARYAERFNRLRSRIGHVFGKRFWSKPVEAAAYWETLIWYIDRNPVKAGLVDDPVDYLWGSAWQYKNSRGPVWLSREIVEDHVRYVSRSTTFDPDLYSRGFGLKFPSEEAFERLWLSPVGGPASRAPIDDLLTDEVGTVAEWLRSIALEGPSNTGIPLLDTRTLTHAIRRARSRAPDWSPRDTAPPRKVWETMAAGLMRMLTCSRYRTIAGQLRVHPGTARSRVKDHFRLIGASEDYVRLVARVVSGAVIAVFGPPTDAPSIRSALRENRRNREPRRWGPL